MLLGTGIIAVLARYTFPYGWSWTESLLFGAMMAATDPVATVAVLSQVGVQALLQCRAVQSLAAGCAGLRGETALQQGAQVASVHWCTGDGLRRRSRAVQQTAALLLSVGCGTTGRTTLTSCVCGTS